MNILEAETDEKERAIGFILRCKVCLESYRFPLRHLEKGIDLGRVKKVIEALIPLHAHAAKEIGK